MLGAHAKKPPEGGSRSKVSPLMPKLAARTWGVFGSSASSRAFPLKHLSALAASGCTQGIGGACSILVRRKRNDIRSDEGGRLTQVCRMRLNNDRTSSRIHDDRCNHLRRVRPIATKGIDAGKRGSCAHALNRLADGRAALRCSQHHFRHARLDGVVLVCRKSHSSQDTNDRHNDHQFDKGKAGLCAAGESTTVH
jgi:hypothetical protein